MTKLSELIPGDEVMNALGERMLFIEKAIHPVWRHLFLVIWKTPRGISLDALNVNEEVGSLVLRQSDGRYARLQTALSAARSPAVAPVVLKPERKRGKRK